MSTEEDKALLLEGLYLRLLEELSETSDEKASEDRPLLISTDEFDFEVRFKKKRKIRLVSGGEF